MNSDNPIKRLGEIPKQGKWNHTPTKALRVPQVFEIQILEYVRSLDNGSLDNGSLDNGSLDDIQSPNQFDLASVLKEIGNFSLEDLQRLQLELPLIIQRKKEESSDRTLENCVLFLRSRCDGAKERDGAGFNGCDAAFGRWLADQIQSRQPLLKTHAKAAWDMLQKYSKQLSGGGLKLSAWESIEHQYPGSIKIEPVAIAGTNQVEVPAKRVEIIEVPAKRVEIIEEQVAVFSPYDATGKFQALAKKIEGYKFNGADKSWRYPLDKALEVRDRLIDDSYYLTESFVGAIALVESQIAEQQAAKEQQLLGVAEETIELIAAAELDKPLTNGWYLREYQKQGAEWLLAHRKGVIHRGAILADQMGLGKTLTTLAAAKGMQATYNCPIFVIAPVSLLENWVREAEKVGVRIECFSWASIPQPLDHQKYLLICDEAHYAQNIDSQRTQKMLALAEHENALAAWLLTGTPIKNGRPINLYPLLVAINHPLAEDKRKYELRFCDAHHKSIGRKSVWDVSGAAHLDELSKKTEDAILRRTKQQCLAELPSKTRLFQKIELDSKQAQEYSQIINLLVEDYRARTDCHTFKRNLSLFFKCPSFAGWVSWVLAYNPASREAEALVTINYLRKLGSQFKLEPAIEMIQELIEQDQQVVVFTEFVESARAIALATDGLLLTGDTKPEDRQKLVDQFQEGQKKVFVGTVKAGGVGLTLTAASNVILVDRPWTPGDCQQAEDRCHRLGQKNAVFAHWLQLGQVDEAIDTLLESKQERIELVLKGKRKTLKGITSPTELARQLLEIL